MQKNYNHTIYASYIGYITQAIINNFMPLLFVTFQKDMGLSLEQLSLIITSNFGVQLLVDLLSAKFADKIGERTMVSAAHFFCAAGMILLAVLPNVMQNKLLALILPTICCAAGGGVIEVLVSPIVEKCPFEHKEAAMSLLHSFYCWGQLLVVLLSTLFFVKFGYKNWALIAVLWAAVPFFNAFYFMKVPLSTASQHIRADGGREFFSKKLFWLFMILMLCAGASEIAMSQWASAFAEQGLHVSKPIGDLAGPCMFALCMGISRVFHAKCSGKILLVRFMMISGVLCVLSYVIAALMPIASFSLFGCALCGLSVGIMWPGTYSLAAKHLKTSENAMFAMLALAGDLGCSAGPALAGIVSAANNNLKTGLLFASAFPIVLIAGVGILIKKYKIKN